MIRVLFVLSVLLISQTGFAAQCPERLKTGLQNREPGSELELSVAKLTLLEIVRDLRPAAGDVLGKTPSALDILTSPIQSGKAMGGIHMYYKLQSVITARIEDLMDCDQYKK